MHLGMSPDENLLLLARSQLQASSRGYQVHFASTGGGYGRLLAGAARGERNAIDSSNHGSLMEQLYPATIKRACGTLTRGLAAPAAHLGAGRTQQRSCAAWEESSSLTEGSLQICLSGHL